MSLRTVRVVAALAVLPFLGAGKTDVSLAEHWTNPGYDRGKLEKVMVIGITDQRDARRHFENKFVSHLKGRGIDAVTSHSLVPDLRQIDAEGDLIEEIARQKIDSAITVRLVPLEGKDATAWTEAWSGGLKDDANLRRLIEDSLPLSGVKASRYGAEVTVWAAGKGSRVWAGRSGPIHRKAVNKGRSGAFVGQVIAQLRFEQLL
jgi:hypothetical protein